MGNTIATTTNTMASAAPFQVDLDKYAGEWTEIGRYKFPFEEMCEYVTVDYQRTKDGLQVINYCWVHERKGLMGIYQPIHKKKKDGFTLLTSAKGEATVENGRLMVKFGPNLPAREYKVLWTDYQNSLVTTADGKYFWWLSRSNEIDTATINQVAEKMREFGVDVNKIIFSKHVSRTN